MSVLAADEITRRLRLPVDHKESLSIAPLLSTDQIGADSVDVHVGNYFLRSQSEKMISFNVGQDLALLQELVHVPFGRFIMLPAGGTILGVVLEYIKLPDDLSAEILTRSSYARAFTTVATAIWIHPGFRGCLTLEITNTSNAALQIEPGMRMAQLVFHEVSESSSEKSSSLTGRTIPHYPDFNKERRWLDRLSGIGDSTGSGSEVKAETGGDAAD